VTRADVEDCYPGSPESFTPTHRARVLDTRDRSRVIRLDYVCLSETDERGVRYAYGPDEERPLSGVWSTGLWQSLEVHGRVDATPVRYDAHYVPVNEREGLVYFIQAGEGGSIKIGWSQKIPQRRASLQTANARRLVVLGAVPGTRETEAALHARFAHLRMEGEWFRNAPELHAFLAANGIDPISAEV
jgi:hypothetical protein